ncbi:unnamed protein product, partial [Prorocentrum cordatum]
MGRNKKPLSALAEAPGNTGNGKLQRVHDALLQSDATTPLNEPRRFGMALTAVYRCALSDLASEQAFEYGENLFMAGELLATYVTLRDGLEESPRVTKIADSPNNNLSENKTMRDIVKRLRLHAAKKTSGADPFFDRLKKFVQPTKDKLGKTCLFGVEGDDDVPVVRELLVKLLLVLAVRSESLLALFEGSDFSVAKPDCLPRLYQCCLDNGSPFPGLRKHRGRNVHTTEQKVWGMGRLADAILFPFWANPTCFDSLLESAENLHFCKLFRSGL